MEMPAVQQCAERVAMHTAGGREHLLCLLDWPGDVGQHPDSQLPQRLPQFLQ